MTVHIVWHPTSLLHEPGVGHPESPARLRAILDELRDADFPVTLEWHEVDPVEDDFLRTVHDGSYLDELRDMASSGGGQYDADTALSSESYRAATYAAGAAVAVTCHALDGRPAFAPIRPPGHHATYGRAMGFCLINNVVVGAHWALTRARADRVLIIDWDVHHGNGTQDLVERDARIRYVSLHQWPLYPGTGRAEERGVGNIFNIPRPPGRPRSSYVSDLIDGVSLAIEDWTPDLILISAGFDAMAGDPLAGFTLEPDDYATLVTTWRSIGVPIASMLEGGYAPERIRKAAAAHVAALA